MGLLFTFKTVDSVEYTISVIKNVLNSIGGKSKDASGGVIAAQWRSKRYLTVMPVKVNFYVGVDMVRVAFACKTPPTKTDAINCREFKPNAMLGVWDDFIIGLETLYPDNAFGLCSGMAKINSVKFLSDGIEQVYYTTSYTRDSGFFIPWAFSSGVTTAKAQIANEILAQVRYTNGLMLEGPINKKTSLYQEIVTNMSILG